MVFHQKLVWQNNNDGFGALFSQNAAEGSSRPLISSLPHGSQQCA
jgi:hypothetical protein